MEAELKARQIILILLVFFSSTLSAAGLDCKIGPVEKKFGGSVWNVYACNDQKSIVLVSAPGSDAHPFYFTFLFSEGGYRLTGEGAGRKAATSAAYGELEGFGEDDIQGLRREAEMLNKKLQPTANAPAE